MKEESLEFMMTEELMGCLDDMTENARKFIQTLHDNLDPYEEFSEQVEGDPEKQRKWLFSLYEKHMNQDEEAAQDVWDS